MINRRDFLRLAAAAGAGGAALILAACGDSTAPASSAAAAAPASSAPASVAPPSAASAPATAASSAPASPAASSAPASAAAKPAGSGTLSIALPILPVTLDPHNTSAPPGYATLYPVFDALTKIDDKGQVQPALATAWTSVDPKTWEFTLRPNVKFTNGEDFNADSVKFSVERVINPDNKLALAARTATFASVQVVSPSTVRILTKTPDPLVPGIMAMLMMLPPKAFAAAGEKAFVLKPIGTGPFAVQEFAASDHVTYSTMANSWRGQPKLAGLKMSLVADDSARLAALQSGQVDAVQKVSTDKIASLQSQYRVETVVLGSVVQGMFKTDTGPLADKRVRQALNYAVDKEAIVKNVLNGQGVVASQIVGPDAYGYNPAVQPYPYDVDKAKSLLKDAGLGDGFKMPMHTLQNPNFGKEVPEAVAGYLSKVGIQSDVTVLENAAGLQEFRQGPWPPVIYASLDYGPVYDASFALTWFTNLQLPTVGHWTNDQYNKLWAAQQIEFDKATRLKNLQDMGALMTSEAGALFLWQGKQIYAIAKNVSWTPGPGLVMWFDDASKS